MELLRLEEVAKRFNLNLKTLRRWAAQRRFPLYKVSTKIRVDTNEFSEWLRLGHCEAKERNQGQ